MMEKNKGREKRQWEAVTRIWLLLSPSDCVSTQMSKDASCASSPLESDGKITLVFSSSEVCSGLVEADPRGCFTFCRYSA